MLQIIFDITIALSLLSLVALSTSLVYEATKFFSLTQAAIISLGAYLVFSFTKLFNFLFFISHALSVFSCVGISLMFELFMFRSMRNRYAKPFSMLVASFGLYIVLQNAISLYFGDDTKVINTAEIVVGHQIFGAYITTVQIITICVSLILFIGVNLFLHFNATGKSIRAVSSNPELCNIYGISSNKVILIAFALGSALAAVAGILSAMDTNMTPTFGFNLLMYGIVAMIIGGVGSTRGLLAGSLLVATAQHLSAFYLDTKWMDAVTYIILILFLIWKPLGFSGKRLKKVEV
jgi:branched-chain amino acid transport system permease protein